MTMNNVSIGEKLGKVAFFYLVAYVLWRFVFEYTFLKSPFIIYCSFCFLTIIFFLTYIKSIKKEIYLPDTMALLWIPFAFYSAVQFFLGGSKEYFLYWCTFILIICLPPSLHIFDKIPFRLFYYNGLFVAISIFFQFFFSSTFNSIYSSIFQNTQKDTWELNGYGFCGFTNQLGVSSEMLFLCELTLLFFWIKKKQNSIFFFLVLFFIILANCLTGKRTNTIIACLIPFIVWFSVNRLSIKKIFVTIFIVILVTFLVSFFLNNINSFSSFQITKRIADTYISFQRGFDFTSRRTYLIQVAEKGFEEKTVWGIGAGFFPEWSHTETEVHNIYYQLLCEQGLVGFILFIIPSFYCFCKNLVILKKSRKYTSLYHYVMFSFLFQLHFFLAGFSENMTMNLSGLLFYALAISLLIDVNNLVNEKEKLLQL